jgi:hypothetical protein
MAGFGYLPSPMVSSFFKTAISEILATIKIKRKNMFFGPHNLFGI